MMDAVLAHATDFPLGSRALAAHAGSEGELRDGGVFSLRRHGEEGPATALVKVMSSESPVDAGGDDSRVFCVEDPEDFLAFAFDRR